MKGKTGKVTTVCIKSGMSSGKQSLGNSDSMIVVIEGQASIDSNNETKLLAKSDSIFIPKNTDFEVFNKSKDDLIYVSIVGHMKVEK